MNRRQLAALILSAGILTSAPSATHADTTTEAKQVMCKGTGCQVATP